MKMQLTLSCFVEVWILCTTCLMFIWVLQFGTNPIWFPVEIPLEVVQELPVEPELNEL